MESTNTHKDADKKLLGEFFATAICSNDILSSVLYVAGIAIVFSGVLAPVVLFLVTIVLYFYKAVYREVVEALPVNGGAYNALLNGTSKTVASLAGVMTVLSYVATAVISAKTAVEYLFNFLEDLCLTNHCGIPPAQIEKFVIPSVILILLFFALLVINGIKDSAKVAFTIFAIHIITLIVFIGIGLTFIVTHPSPVFYQNVLNTQKVIAGNGGIWQTLFLGFSASLLGVSGFESSANFVEEQQKGVFKKTLRNMLVGILIFNPLSAFVVINILPLRQIGIAKDSLLSVTAHHTAGIALVAFIAIDAFLVLCGAVLTAFVGISGLAGRMVLDECLPQVLMKENKNGSQPRIIFGFFLLCTSILIVTHGDLLSLAGVYTISFLSVMSLFAFGNLLLRKTRRDLKRPYHAPFIFVVLALISTIIGIIGNILLDRNNIVYFLTYFIPAAVIVSIMLYKADWLRFFIDNTVNIPPLQRMLQKKYNEILEHHFYVFIHHTNNLYRILEYIENNENGTHITLIHCSKGDLGEKETMINAIPVLKKAGAFTDLHVGFEYVDAPFGPEIIETISHEKHVPKNRIFIGSIHDFHTFNYDELGGVRIIS